MEKSFKSFGFSTVEILFYENKIQPYLLPAEFSHMKIELK